VLGLPGLAGSCVSASRAPPEERVKAGLASDSEVDCQEVPAVAGHVVHVAGEGLGVVGVVGADVFGFLGHARIVGLSMRLLGGAPGADRTPPASASYQRSCPHATHRPLTAAAGCLHASPVRRSASASADAARSRPGISADRYNCPAAEGGATLGVSFGSVPDLPRIGPPLAVLGGVCLLIVVT
jgi:hypothetical protein